MMAREGTMRAFFALPLDPEVRAAIGRVAAPLQRATRSAATWVDPENYHVTLRFLGDIDPRSTAALRELAVAAARECAPFELSLQTLGAFPSVERARVLWVGGATPDAFRALAASIERGVVAQGFPPEPKPAVAHVTIARLKAPPDDRLREAVARAGSLALGIVRPREVALVESELRPGGPRYTPLFAVPIGHEQT
jgi:2'-5' RNA ligase